METYFFTSGLQIQASELSKTLFKMINFKFRFVIMIYLVAISGLQTYPGLCLLVMLLVTIASIIVDLRLLLEYKISIYKGRFTFLGLVTSQLFFLLTTIFLLFKNGHI
jgi:hypothetical protein